MQQLLDEISLLLSSSLWDTIQITENQLQTPPKKDLWDLCIALFDYMKQYKIWPNHIADTIVSQHNLRDNSVIESISQAWPYLNIKLSKLFYAEVFYSYFSSKAYYSYKENQGVVVVDYIWANVWKPMHIWHLCTPLQWQTCINTFKKLWYQVIGDSHIGDWWIIFWKLIVWYSYYWDEEQLKNDAVEHLFEIYVKISSDAESNSKLEQDFRDAFKLLASGDASSIVLWKKFTSSSIDSMNILLNRLFVQPDYNIGESFYEWLNLPKIEDYPDLKYSMHQIVTELIEKWIATKNDDNSVGVIFSDDSKLPSCILQKRDGTHGYLASDLACIKYRIDNWKPSRIIYFVDVRQQLHFKQAFEIVKQAWWVGDTVLEHAHNGFISLKDWAMSTRKWRIIKLSKLLDEASQRAKNIIVEKRSDFPKNDLEKLSEIVGIGAVKYWYLKKSRELDSVFDWEEFMTFEWNSWPYLQYAYVRARKILLQADTNNFTEMKFEFTLDKETQFIQKLLDFPSVIDEISENYNFHQLCLYLYELTKIFSSFYNDVEVLSENNDVLKYSRLALLKCFTEILEEWFWVLGIQLPHEM